MINIASITTLSLQNMFWSELRKCMKQMNSATKSESKLKKIFVAVGDFYKL